MAMQNDGAADRDPVRHGREALSRAALFLDRDGVINIDTGYPHRPADLAFTPSAVDAIRIANAARRPVIVLTNQSGVARGLFGVEAVHAFHDLIQQRLAAGGAHVDAFYMCPYHPQGSVPAFRADHEDRKPKPGMFLRAMADWPIDPDRSLMVGDKPSDLAAAAAVGVPAILVPSDTVDLRAVVQDWLDGRTDRQAG